MSDVSRGAGWWLASDGKWYPPESHPSRATERYQPFVDATATSQGVDPYGAARGAVTKVTTGGGGWSAAPDAYWSEQEVFSSDKHAKATSQRRGTLDGRGLLAGAAGFVALVSTSLDWYRATVVTATNGHTYQLVESFRLLSQPYAIWRMFIPVTAFLAIAFGIANFVLRPGDRGAVFVFVALRVLIVALLGLCIAALVVKVPHLAAVGLLSPITSAVLWPAWTATIAAGVGFLGLFATETKNK